MKKKYKTEIDPNVEIVISKTTYDSLQEYMQKYFKLKKRVNRVMKIFIEGEDLT